MYRPPISGNGVYALGLSFFRRSEQSSHPPALGCKGFFQSMPPQINIRGFFQKNTLYGLLFRSHVIQGRLRCLRQPVGGSIANFGFLAVLIFKC